MAFKSQGGNVRDIFVTEEELIERFTGKQLWLWGAGGGGRLGNNNISDQSSPVQTISLGTNWRAVSTGEFHTAATKTDGTLWTWGCGLIGRLGTNSAISQSSPVQTVSGGTNWRSVSVGRCHTAAIKTDGTLWTWGFGYQGQLGNNDITNRSSPVQTVSGGTNWRTVSASSFHTAATKTDGTLWTWGLGFRGQLGNNDITNRSSPVQTVSGGTNWRTVSVGRCHTAATKTDGTLWTWGCGSIGQLGNNAIANQSSPVQTVSGGTNWRTVSAGSYHTAAIKTDGELWLWGSGTIGLLGTNSTTNRSSPVQTVSGGTNWRTVSAGDRHTAATKTDGTLWLWGDGNDGRLGTNSAISQSSPVQTVSGGTNWRTVSAGCVHTASNRLEEF
jgi:alpha-tubulin suppressor-like RCC1 family protein